MSKYSKEFKLEVIEYYEKIILVLVKLQNISSFPINGLIRDTKTKFTEIFKIWYLKDKKYKLINWFIFFVLFNFKTSFEVLNSLKIQ